LQEAPLHILNQYWGYPGFRPPQEEIIASVMSGRDTLALLPTGGGKSICFQVPGLCLKGTTLVISPLISLMKDQVERLNQLGIAATYIHGGMPYHLIDHRLDQAMKGIYTFLYIAPERLKSDMFALRLPHMNVKLLAVDEAHCISQWGYDFRPAYLDIYQIRETFSDIPILALTASAPPHVQQDIIDKLHLSEVAVFTKSFKRENLRYFVVTEQNVAQRTLEIAQRVQGTGIIYARTRKRTQEIARMLQQHEIEAAAYHGGMTHSQRDDIQQKWIQNDIRIIAATNAFGMGIDKPDVRFVIHYNLPADIESYYQEAGRGGRDGQTALAIAFNNPIDITELERWSKDKYPTFAQVQTHFTGLCHYLRIPQNEASDQLYPLDMQDLAKALSDNVLSVYRSLQLLARENLLQLADDHDDYGYIQFTCEPATVHIYKAQHPQLADLIDFILRQLGGEVFTQEIRFLPSRWATLLRIDTQQLLQQLQRLKQHHLIGFVNPAGHPTVKVLISHRLLSREELDWDKYTFLQTQHQQRLQEMLGYITSHQTCRSLLIQRYFGEETDSRCGKCDVCVKQKPNSVSKLQFSEIQQAILTYIRQQGDISYRKLLLQFPKGTPEQREEVLRYLIDKQLVIVNPSGLLKLP